MTASPIILPTPMNTPTTPPPSRSKSLTDTTAVAEDITPQPAAKTTPQTYPRGTPITPPSPVLSVSQLKVPPSRSNGTIPIFFDSDSESESPFEDDDSLPAFRNKQEEESPSAAARRRSALKHKRHDSDATVLSDAPTSGRNSTNSFGVPRLFEKIDTKELASKEPRPISIETTSFSPAHSRPISSLSFASTITIDSPLPNNRPLPLISLPSLTPQKTQSGLVDPPNIAEKTNYDTPAISFAPPLSYPSHSFSLLTRSGHEVEAFPNAYLPFTAAAHITDSEVSTQVESATIIQVPSHTARGEVIIRTPMPTVKPKQVIRTADDHALPPQAIQSPVPASSSTFHSQVLAPPLQIRGTGSNIPADTIPAVESSPSYSASQFAYRVSEQYQRELEREKPDGRLSPLGLRSRSSSAGRLGVRFRSRSPSANTVVLPPFIESSSAVSSPVSPKHSDNAVTTYGPISPSSSSFPRVQGAAMGKRRPWTSAGPATTKKSALASFSLRGRAADPIAGTSLPAHLKRPMSAQTRRPSTSTSSSIIHVNSGHEMTQDAFSHPITPSSRRSEWERSPSEEHAIPVGNATAFASLVARNASPGSASRTGSRATSKESKDDDSDHAHPALRPYTAVDASHLRNRPGISSAHGRGPWPYMELASDDGSSKAPSYSRPSMSHAEDSNVVDDGSSPGFARLEASGLGHLSSTVVCLLMDQEHFREVMPRFHFSRITRSPSSPKYPSHIPRPSMSTTASGGSSIPLNARSESSDSSGPLAPSDSVLEFKPAQRQSHAFHYAPLDTPPTLRRLHLNDDMKRDYLSREASLVLKNNGVYSVRGTEDKGRIFWQFMYLVDDRRNAAGEKMSGEKMLTPLGFTCSPGLLTQERGKKIGLLQVAKKAFLPKLTAAKLDPPALSRTPPPPPPPLKGGHPPEPMIQLVDISNAVDRRSPQTPRQPNQTMGTASLKSSNNAPPRISSAPTMRTRPATSAGETGVSLGPIEPPQRTASTAVLSDFRPIQASEPSNTPSRADSMTATANSPPSTQAFRVELETSKEAPHETALSAINMWDAKENLASRRAKAVLLRPVTSRNRTSEQAVAVDTILSPSQRTGSIRQLRGRQRPATAGAVPSSLPIDLSFSNRPPRLQNLTPTTVPPPPAAPGSAPASARSNIPLSFFPPPLAPIPPNGNDRLGGRIASRDQIRAWLSETPPKTPLLPPISTTNGHSTIFSPSGVLNSSSPTSPVLSSPVSFARSHPTSPSRVSPSPSPPQSSPKVVRRPKTAHGIPTKPHLIS